MKLDVFGRHMLIQRENGQWIPYLLGPDGKKRLLHDIVIPDSLSESDVVVFIGDIYHESATPERPAVKRIE